MTTSIDPTTEALQAITDRINSGTAYELSVAAQYGDDLTDELSDLDVVQVGVAEIAHQQLEETLATTERTSHDIHVVVRQKVATPNQEYVDRLKLLTRQIFERLNNFDSADGRVRVWECQTGAEGIPDRTALKQDATFVARIRLRVEVEPPA